MNSHFRFQLKTDLYYGIGWSRNLGQFIQEKGYKRVFVLVDEGCAEHSPYFLEIEEILEKEADYLCIEILRGNEEPDYDYLDEVSDKVRSMGPLDILVGIGGGSCLDITKAVAVLLINPGKGIEFRGFDKVEKPGIPTICIPTTAGTGSEVTINAVFTDKKEMKKLGINGRYLNATYAILDAEWTMSCPDSVALSSGMDAMTHALESFSCKQHNSMTRVYSRSAFKVLYENLPSLVDDPSNKQCRQNLLMGSYLAATGLFNSGSGIAGAFSYPIGVHYKVPHGIGGAVFLASVVDFNVKRGYTDYAELLDMVEVMPGADAQKKSICFAQRLNELSDRLGVPNTLAQWGIKLGNLDDLKEMMIPLQAAFDQNPIVFSAEKDAPDLLRHHLD